MGPVHTGLNCLLLPATPPQSQAATPLDPQGVEGDTMQLAAACITGY